MPLYSEPETDTWCFSTTAIIYGSKNQWMVLGVAPLTIKPNDLLALPSWGFADLAFLVLKDFFQQINNYGLTESEATTLI